MNHLDLFSGIGGFALAAQWQGLKTVGFCEIEPFAKKVLTKNFPHIPIHEDVRNTADFAQYAGKIHLLTGGYPCQPFSVAGKQKGEKDDRHLWPAMLEIIKLVRPTWVLAENVGGHIKLGLDQVLSDLEAEGYATRAIVIPACAKDAPHRRDRVWILGHSEHDGLTTTEERRSSTEAVRDQQKRQKQTSEPERADVFHSDSQSIYDAAYARSQRGEGCLKKAFLRKPSLSWSENCRTLKDWRELPDLLQPLVSGGSNGVPNRVDRTRGLGNAIVPQVAAEIIHAILNHH